MNFNGKRTLSVLAAAAAGVIVCTNLAAQTPSVDVGGVVNVASYAYADLPGGGVAQGSIFGIFGKNLGPAAVVEAKTYPLPTTLSGVSVKVTSGSTTANAVLFAVSAGQINALLPSSIAAGTATLTVTNNGATSAPASFKVVANSFGIFTRNSGGSGPGDITNAQGVTYGLTNAANPDDVAIIWGTGLGPVQGNEAGGALPGDLTSVPIEIYVGAQKAAVSYRGRSGCCAGLDQITFTIPNVTGCRVPITAKIGNTVGNFATLPIAAKGTRTCTDPGGPTAADLQKYQTQGGAAIGGVVLSRTNTSLTLPFVGTITTSADLGAASFARYTIDQLNASQNPFNTYTVGTCSVYYYKGATAASSDPTQPKSLDAGTAISVNGPKGSKQLTKQTTAGLTGYSGLLSTIGASGSVGYLDPGNYAVSGSGGADIGGFNTQVTLPASLTWANQDAITDVTRSAGQNITWSGGDPNGVVLISGYSATGSAADSVGAGFSCVANNSDKQFLIPAQVLLSMPPSVSVQGVPTAALIVGSYTNPVKITASGLDAGYLLGTVNSLKNLNFK